ncbi:spexin-like [Acipenser oxyrinchus oxyrinchus]|uniref:Spexin-like n=1 Tax=Acipenser oxyrinchus oxyrinchus TaxID=40147 RepID=A0AAD8CXH4_ACIOX|nr:spexin-like [Acipenser oxyrinchus oxyrinchus]
MNNRTTFMFTCTVVLLFLVAETSCASKSRVNAKNWGPQAMMYLKGRYGRRYASDYDEEDQFYKVDANNLNMLLKGYQKSRAMGFRNIRRISTAENIEIRYL